MLAHDLCAHPAAVRLGPSCEIGLCAISADLFRDEDQDLLVGPAKAVHEGYGFAECSLAPQGDAMSAARRRTGLSREASPPLLRVFPP